MNAENFQIRRIERILMAKQQLLDQPIESLYKKIYVRKRNKNVRIIYQPCSELKNLQLELIPFFRSFEISKYVTAYERGCSIKKNALVHQKAKHILHMDIKDFFPSVTESMFENVFCQNIEYEIVYYLWRAVSVNGGLPIGAPTSSFIANRILFKMDNALGKLSGFFKKYTRYADDMIFSSKRRIDDSFKYSVERVVAENGFAINPKKTYFMSKRKQVTGILVHKKSISVGTNYKKRLKSEVYNFLVKREGYVDIIKGKLSYLKHIEPNYFKVLKNKYSHLDTACVLFEF